MQKKVLFPLLSLLVCDFSVVFSDDFTFQDMTFIESDPSELTIPEKKPTFKFDGRVDYIFPATFTTPGVTDQEMSWMEMEFQLRYLCFWNPDLILSINTGYNFNSIKWKDSPVLNADPLQFNMGILGFGFISHESTSWNLQGEIDVYLDLEQLGEIDSHLLVLGGWTRYACSPCWGASIGFLARTGIKDTHVWPVLGLDYTWKCWEINAIYPVNMSIIYHMNKEFAFSVVGHIINSRHRLNDEQFLYPRGIVEYRNYGFEFACDYTYCEFLSINLHAGMMSGGDLVVSDRSDENETHYKSEGAPYVGGTFKVFF